MTDVVVGLQIYFFIFHTAPEALDKHIVQPAPLAIHADLNAVLLEYSGERLTGELTTLIRVKNIKGAMNGQRFL